MTKEIEPIVEEEIQGTENINITPYGVEFLNKPTIQEWHDAVLKVQKVHGMMQFYLGDLMVFAESPVTGWGEGKYNDLIAATGYDYGTLRNYASIARRFSAEFREEILSFQNDTFVTFTHFQMVASLDDVKAKYYLKMVAEGRWTVVRLREEVAKFKNGGILPEKVEKEVEEWRANVKASLKRIIDSQPETIVIRSMVDGKIVAEEIVEVL